MYEYDTAGVPRHIRSFIALNWDFRDYSEILEKNESLKKLYKANI